MSKVVNIDNYRRKLANESSNAIRDGLIPIEFAIGIGDREVCLDKMATYGVSSIYVRTINGEPGSHLYLIGVSDAILLNKKILANEDISDEEVEHRIDLIQMMENMNFAGMDSLWESLSSKQGDGDSAAEV
jgi:hypothetical protein